MGGLNTTLEGWLCSQDKSAFEIGYGRATQLPRVFNNKYSLRISFVGKTKIKFFFFFLVAFYICTISWNVLYFLIVWLLKFEHYAAEAVSPRAWESRCSKGAGACAHLSVFCWKGMTGVLYALCSSIATFLGESSVYSTVGGYSSGKRIWRLKTVSWSGRLCDQSVWVCCFILHVCQAEAKLHRVA